MNINSWKKYKDNIVIFKYSKRFDYNNTSIRFDGTTYNNSTWKEHFRIRTSIVREQISPDAESPQRRNPFQKRNAHSTRRPPLATSRFFLLHKRKYREPLPIVAPTSPPPFSSFSLSLSLAISEWKEPSAKFPTSALNLGRVYIYIRGSHSHVIRSLEGRACTARKRESRTLLAGFGGGEAN